MNETRRFPTIVILSLLTGRTFAKFNDVHEAFEFVLGYPIWTHELALEEFWNRVRYVVLTQHPDLAMVKCKKRLTPEEANEFVSYWQKSLGQEIELTRGNELRTAGPLENLRKIAPEKTKKLILVKKL
jgi:hypothetical protein